jgi:hypothetical protein
MREPTLPETAGTLIRLGQRGVHIRQGSGRMERKLKRWTGSNSEQPWELSYGAVTQSQS